MAVGQVWATSSLGGFLYSDELSEVIRTAVQPLVRFRQFCDADDATGKGLRRGDLYHWDVISDISSQGGTLVETNTIPEGNFTITQGTLTVVERAQAVPFTQKLDNLSKLPVKRIVQSVLKDDCRKAMDIAAEAQFNNTLLRAYPASSTSTTQVTLTSNGTAGGTNSVGLKKGHVTDLVDKMKERNVPAFSGDDYFAIAHPTTFRSLMTDLESVRQYVDAGYQLIMNGEKGRYEGVRIVEQTAIAKGTFAAGLSNWAYFFGADTVMEAIAIPEEIRGKVPTDYGRSMGISWYSLNGFGLVHGGATATVSQARIFKWDSAG